MQNFLCHLSWPSRVCVCVCVCVCVKCTPVYCTVMLVYAASAPHAPCTLNVCMCTLTPFQVHPDMVLGPPIPGRKVGK